MSNEGLKRDDKRRPKKDGRTISVQEVKYESHEYWENNFKEAVPEVKLHSTKQVTNSTLVHTHSHKIKKRTQIYSQ